MANNKTKIGFFEALRLCVLVIVDPNAFLEEQARDNERCESLPRPPQIPSAFLVRNAFWSSLGLVVASTVAGFAIGQGYSRWIGAVSAAGIRSSQIVGAMILLWGTLFVRGWDIQTWAGTNLAERVNQWIFKGLYCIGTAIIVFSFTVKPA